MKIIQKSFIIRSTNARFIGVKTGSSRAVCFSDTLVCIVSDIKSRISGEVGHMDSSPSSGSVSSPENTESVSEQEEGSLKFEDPKVELGDEFEKL